MKPLKTKILLLLTILGCSCFSSFSQKNLIQNGTFQNITGQPLLTDGGCTYITPDVVPGWDSFGGASVQYDGEWSAANVNPATNTFYPITNSTANYLRVRGYKYNNSYYSSYAWTSMTLNQNETLILDFDFRCYGPGAAAGSAAALEIYATNNLQQRYSEEDESSCNGDIPDLSGALLVGSIDLQDPANANNKWIHKRFQICDGNLVTKNYTQLLILPRSYATISSIDIVEVEVDNFVATKLPPYSVPSNITVCQNQPVTITASGAKWYAFGSPSGLVQGGYSNTYTASYSASITMHVDGAFLNGCPDIRKYVAVNVIPTGSLGTTTVKDITTIPCASDTWKQWRYDATATSPGASNFYWTYNDIYNNTINTTSTELFISSGGSAGYVPVITVYGFNQCGGKSSTISFLAETTRSYPTCINAPARIGIVDEPTDAIILNIVNNIEIQNLIKDDWNIIVISIEGKEVKRVQSSGESDVNINTADLKPGIYIVKMESSTGKTIQKKVAITQ